MLALFGLGFSSQGFLLAQRSQSRSFRSLETHLALLCLEKGDLNQDRQLDRKEWFSLMGNWQQALGYDNQPRLSRPEFLRECDRWLVAQQEETPQRSSRMLPSRYLGLFEALDSNHDQQLSKEEFRETMMSWLEVWSENTGRIDQDTLVKGWQRVLPRNNMSGVDQPDRRLGAGSLPSAGPSPVRTPQASMESMVLEEGFTLTLAASEPMIQDPVAMSFDPDGRLYVVEMRSFMMDIDGREEGAPISRISRLEDRDGDGIMDSSTIFLDHLIVPRAVLALKEGVLFVDQYILKHATDTNGDGTADWVQIIDRDYGRSNIEHAPNGLMPGMDNWIYNGRSPWRYRCIDGLWIKERTEIRGQWGMTQDAHGRLFYNVNNSQLLGDLTPPNYMSRHRTYPSTAGLNLFVAADQSVHTLRMNTAVNRGYLPEVLDDRGRLHVFASSCSPLIYRGDHFPPGLSGNAFVCDPAANLVKRNILHTGPLHLSAEPAHPDREFLASTDERFRPVALTHGPDGALWLLDMYRGIAQYGMFMTDYLRKETLRRGLDQGIHQGRLYRIGHESGGRRTPAQLSRRPPTEWIQLLDHDDGWLRQTAQRLLIQQGDQKMLDALLRFMERATTSVGLEHALWTIEGLLMSVEPASLEASPSGPIPIVSSVHALGSRPFSQRVWKACLGAMEHPDPMVQTAAIRVCESLARSSQSRAEDMMKQFREIAWRASEDVLFQIILTLGNLPAPDNRALMAELALEASKHWLLREALISGLEGFEWDFITQLNESKDLPSSSKGLQRLLRSLAEATASQSDGVDLGHLIKYLVDRSTSWNDADAALLDGLDRYFRAHSRGPRLLTQSPFPTKKDDLPWNPALQSIHHRLSPWISWPGHPHYATALEKAAKTRNERMEDASMASHAEAYQMVCAGCHGSRGEGLKNQAPPLHQADWVLGSKDRLIRIALHGAQGPIHVGGQLYQSPDILSEMPPLSVLENEVLASILTYIRQAWGHASDPIDSNEVSRVRAATAGRQTPWTEKELLSIP